MYMANYCTIAFAYDGNVLHLKNVFVIRNAVHCVHIIRIIAWTCLELI